MKEKVKSLVAALSFFTRLPFWRLTPLEVRHYEGIVPLWPVAGLLTGSLMAIVFYAASSVLPVSVSVVLALASRILLTGGLHEDGFADFCDGFGGSATGDWEQDRERTLRIMKDSFIGTYGVLGLLLYGLLIYSTLCALAALLPSWQLACLMVITDCFSKHMSAMIVYFLSYARTAEGAKNRVVYAKGRRPWLSMLLALLSLDCLVLWPLFRWMNSRIGGYTGDCCGATFLILELFNYLLLLLCISSL